jgi:hypothetical protein
MYSVIVERSIPSETGCSPKIIHHKKEDTMNTKIFFVLLLIVLVANACAPAIVDGAAPLVPAIQPANSEPSVFVPVTGNSASVTARDAQESRQWSGEISLSDKNSPDLKLNNDVHSDSHTGAACMAEDSQPKRQSGCME